MTCVMADSAGHLNAPIVYLIPSFYQEVEDNFLTNGVHRDTVENVVDVLQAHK